MKKTGTLATWAFSAFLFFSCSNAGETTSFLEVRLTDAPGDYEAVNIDIADVQVNSGADEDGWKSLDVNKGVYDLLKLTNGLDTLLGKIELPAGRVSQVRLILGENNSLSIDGQAISLSTPSGQQSGLKLQVNADLVEGITYKLLLDFDAARSVVRAGSSGNYNLKPVIRTIVEAESGAIKGMVSPVEASPAVYAIQSSDTLGTAFADQTTGKFLINGLSAGTYKITIEPKTGFQATIKDAVSVTIGNVTDLGTITILQ
ncbi:MAG: DUF4382 domain-containing protein [Bacteroidota bacterium]